MLDNTPSEAKANRTHPLKVQPELFALRVELLQLDDDDVPTSGAVLTKPFRGLRIGVPTNERQVVIQAGDEAALARLRDMTSDPLVVPCAPTIRLRSGVTYVVFAADGRHRGGPLTDEPGLLAVATYTPINLLEVDTIGGSGPPQPDADILAKVPDGGVAYVQAETEREARAKAVLARMDYPEGPSDIELFCHAADTLRRLEFTEGTSEMLISERHPDVKYRPTIERAVAVAYGVNLAGRASAVSLSEIAWTLRPILPRPAVGLLIGASTSGKSFAALDLALAAAAGGKFHDHAFERPTGVVILTAPLEYPELVEPRLRSMALDRGLELDGLPIAHMTCRAPGEVAPLIGMADKRLRAEFGVGAGLIVLDSLSGIYGVDEDDEQGAVQIMGALRRLSEGLEATVLLIHHEGLSRPGPRGSTAWFGSATFSLRIDFKRNGRSGFAGARRLILDKTKVGASRELGPFRIESSPWGDVLRLGADPSEARPSEDRPTRVNRSPPAPVAKVAGPGERLRRALISARDTGRTVEVGGCACVLLNSVRDTFLDGQPAPRYERNLRRAILTAAARIGATRVDHGGNTYLTIPAS